MEKFKLFVDRIIDCLGEGDSVEPFTPEEMQKLQQKFELRSEELTTLLNGCSYIFEQVS